MVKRSSSKSRSSKKKMSKKEKQEKAKEETVDASRDALQHIIGNQGPKIAAAFGIAWGLKEHAIPLFDKILQGNLLFPGIGEGLGVNVFEPPVTRLTREALEGAAGTALPGIDEFIKGYFMVPDIEAFGKALGSMVTRTEQEKAKAMSRIDPNDLNARERIERASTAKIRSQYRAVFTKTDIRDSFIAWGAAWFLLSLAEEKTFTEIVNNMAEALPL